MCSICGIVCVIIVAFFFVHMPLKGKNGKQQQHRARRRTSDRLCTLMTSEG